jgi:hypothetical protein
VAPNETPAPTERRHRRRRAFSSGVAIITGSLLIGGLTTYAAATASANSQTVSLSSSAALAPAGGPTQGSTTTTTAPPQAVDTSSTAGSPGTTVQQTIGIAILPGSLSVAPTAESVALTQLRLLGHTEPDYLGSLSTITVNDARGSLVGWRTTVSLQTVSGLDAAQLASTRLCVSPHPTTLVAGNPADVVRSSPRACAGPGDPISVFFAAPGGGGGVYSGTASVALAVPNGTLPAGATASLAVSVS